MKSKSIQSINNPIVDLLVTNIPLFLEDKTVDEVVKILLDKINDFETIDYIYIVDDKKKLKGVVSIKELLKSDKSFKLNKFVNRKIISVKLNSEQEMVAMIALKNDLKEIPVVDNHNVFLGVITYNSILQIMHKEGVDNILKFGGVFSSNNMFDDISNMSILKSIKHRIPWLILGLLGGFLMAGIINHFEEVLFQNIILASFIPLIIYMSSAVGTQMQSFIIRDLAISPNLKIISYFLKQTIVVILISLIISFLMYLITLFLYNNHKISIVFFIAFICAIISSLFTGIIVPYFFERINLDPANASGPIATIIQDTLSVVIYFVIANIILL